MAHQFIAEAGAQKCRKCGAPLGEESRRGFCGRCHFAEIMAMRVETDTQQPATEESTGLQSENANPDRKQPRRIGDYELYEELGRGGMGIVYRARQLSVGRQVAVKMLRFGPMAGEETVKRLRMEATAAGCLRHPNIVAIHEVGIHHDQHYLVMDYVAGPNLASLTAHQPWPASRAASLVKTVAEAIHHAHNHGILHRDLEPSNILVEPDDQPRVTDFGLAKRIQVESQSGLRVESGSEPRADASLNPQLNSLSTDLTITGQVLGSPNYMPPEQAAAGKGNVGRYSDVYSLGAVLYHLLTGRPPFLGETIPATLHQLLEADPPSPRLLSPLVPADLETICLKCLEKEPARRYATARELAEELGRFLKSEPIQARPISQPQRLWRWCQRHPDIASLASATVLLILAVAIGSPIAALRIEAQRKRAVRGETDAQRFLYIANMDLAQQAWEQNKLSRLERLLDETSTYPGRGFEWYFWKRQLHQRSKTLRGHLDEITSISVSPDGLRVASSSQDRTAKVWDLATGREIMTLTGHTARIGKVCWFPDGWRLATASDDHSIKLWDVLTGRELATLKPRRGRIKAVAISPDSRWLASANQDGTASLWELPNGLTKEPPSLVVSVPSGESANGTGGSPALLDTKKARAAFPLSPREERVGREPERGEIPDKSPPLPPFEEEREKKQDVPRIPNPLPNSTGGFPVLPRSEATTFQGHTAAVLSVAFSGDGQFLLTGSEDNTARIWRLADGGTEQILKGHGDYVREAVFSRNGQSVVTGIIWEVSTGRMLRRLAGHGTYISSVAFSPDDQSIATASHDRTVKVWDATDGRERMTLDAHAEQVESVAFSPDGRRLVTGAQDHLIKIWRIEASADHLELPGHQKEVFSVAFSPNSQRLASASSDGSVRIWQESGRELQSLAGHKEGAFSVRFSPDGQRVVTTGRDATVRIWELASGKEVFAFTRHSSPVWSAEFSPDGRWIASSSSDQIVRLWEAASGQERFHLAASRKTHRDVVQQVAFDPDGKRMVTASWDGTARVWDASTGRELLTLSGHHLWVHAAAFSRDGRWIATASGDQTAKIWDAASGQERFTLAGHPGHSVTSVAFTADSTRVVTGSWDGTAKIWDVVTGRQLLSLSVPARRVLSVATSPDGRRIALGTDRMDPLKESRSQTNVLPEARQETGCLAVWEASSSEQLAQWAEDEKKARDRMAVLDREFQEEFRRERASRLVDQGIVRHCLMLAPIPFAPKQTPADALETEFIANERSLQPKAGERVRVGPTELEWRSLEFPDSRIDFADRRYSEMSAGYAVSYLESESDQTGIRLLIGSDDLSKLYLNGEEVYKSQFRRGLILDEDAVEGLKLRAGRNVLVFKVLNVSSHWLGSLRLTDAAGRPLKGIKANLASIAPGL